jgi:hypothetical protein
MFPNKSVTPLPRFVATPIYNNALVLAVKAQQHKAQPLGRSSGGIVNYFYPMHIFL